MSTVINTSALICDWMVTNGLTYETAARKIGAAVGAVHGWRSGGPLPSRLAIPSLAAALGIPAAELAALVARERSARLVPTPKAAGRGVRAGRRAGSCRHYNGPSGAKVHQ